MAFILAINGPSGSGKTTFARAVARLLSKSGLKVLNLTLDDYYRDQSHRTAEERANLNFDQPEALDHDLLHAHLCELEAGAPVRKPVYCFVEHRVVRHEWIHPNEYDVIIIEGIMLLTFKAIQNRLSERTIYVDTPQPVCFWRRLKRDRHERGRSIWSILKQYFTTVLPGWWHHIEPYKYRARFRIFNSLDEKAHSNAANFVRDHLQMP